MILARMRHYAVMRPETQRGEMGSEVLRWIAHSAPQTLCVYANGDGLSAHEWGERKTTMRMAYAPPSTQLRKRWRVVIPEDGTDEVYEVVSFERLARECRLLLELRAA